MPPVLSHIKQNFCSVMVLDFGIRSDSQNVEKFAVNRDKVGKIRP